MNRKESPADQYSTPPRPIEVPKNSAGHNTNMLNASYTRIGIGRAIGGTYGAYWTTVFGGASHSSCAW
jgi:uncharacterized protein YkwD